MLRPVPKLAAGPAARSDVLVYAVLGAVTAAVWWSWAYRIDLVYAMKGFSPIAWVYKMLHPGDFAQDFPGGSENYGRSAFMYVYPAATWLGISPEALLPAVIAVEVMLFGWAMWALCRELVPDASPVVRMLVVVLSIATPVRDMNLAYFPQPYFSGQYYNAADALRIFGIVMVLRGRPLPAAALLGASFATHPLLGLTGLACAAAMLLAQPREMLKARYLAGGAVFALIAGGWLLLYFRSAEMSGGQIPVEDWLGLTRAFSYHWYPVDDGLFSTRGHFVLLPFLSFLLLLAYYWPGRDTRSNVTGKALAGIVAMLGLSIIGLVISAVVPVPALIKLALHRSNDLVIMIGLVYVVDGLLRRDAEEGSWWRWAVAAAVLFSLSRAKSFLCPHTVLSIVLVSPAWLRVLRRQAASGADWIVAALAATAGGFGLVYQFAGMTAGMEPYFLFASGRAVLFLAVFLVLSAAVARRGRKHLLQGLAVVAVVGVALAELREWSASKVNAGLARDYLQAQVWARDHTPRNALFMPPPTFYYGWRDYSRRSSFGNLREWLHTSWIYDSKFEPYREGMRRFGEFNIDIKQYLQVRPPIAAMDPLTKAVKERYYTASDEWRLGLAQRYGIAYFVFLREEIVQPSRLPVVYENEHFVIRAVSK